MKKKLFTAFLAGVLGSAVILSGSVSTFAAEAETETEVSKDQALNIGENVEGAFRVMLTNHMGKDIKAVKISENTQYDEKENLMQEEDIFAADEERMLCYLPEVKEETDKEETDKEEKKDDEKVPEAPVYNIQFTFTDDTTAEIHTFPFGDIESGELCMEEDIAYLIFEAVSLKEEINTLETEKTIAATIKAQKEAAEAAAAAAASSDNYYDDYSDNSGYTYESSGNGGGGEAAGGDQCLTGGLLN